MRATKLSHAVRSMLAMAVITLASATFAAAQYTSSVIYTFPKVDYPLIDPAVDASNQAPSNLIFDNMGNFYGTVAILGDACIDGGRCAKVFELSQSGGVWTETTLYTFNGNGVLRLSQGVVRDSAGNLYGAALTAGNEKACNSGCGFIYELSPISGGWSYKVIHVFSGTNGSQPTLPMVDGAGNLYGTTESGGSTDPNSLGVVYELTKTAAGGYIETVLHRFTGGNDGGVPTAPLVMDGSGNLYGTALQGGTHGSGTVYKLTSNGAGGFTFGVIHDFAGDYRGGNPSGPLLLDAARNLYGTTGHGGSLLGPCSYAMGCGTVFELVNTGTGYSEKVLRIVQATEDGDSPGGALLMDPAGNLYGTTPAGKGFDGSVFELSPNGDRWIETILLTGTSSLGGFNGVVLDSAGNLYGPASDTEIFELSPPTP